MKVSRTDALLGLRLGLVVAAVLLASPAVGLFGEISEERAAVDSPQGPPASDVVPAEVVLRPPYQLGPTVRTFTFMNQYSVTSDYGSFHPPSDARLRRLVREIAAIAGLQKIHQSDAFAKATVDAGKGVVQGAQHLINDPVGTIGA